VLTILCPFLCYVVSFRVNLSVKRLRTSSESRHGVSINLKTPSIIIYIHILVCAFWRDTRKTACRENGSPMLKPEESVVYLFKY